MLRYQVDDMSCGHCVQSITEAVKGVDAGATVQVDLATKRVEVETTATDSQVAGAIRGAGYTPDPKAGTPERASGGCCGRR